MPPLRVLTKASLRCWHQLRSADGAVDHAPRLQGRLLPGVYAALAEVVPTAPCSSQRHHESPPGAEHATQHSPGVQQKQAVGIAAGGRQGEHLGSLLARGHIGPPAPSRCLPAHLLRGPAVARNRWSNESRWPPCDGSLLHRHDAAQGRGCSPDRRGTPSQTRCSRPAGAQERSSASLVRQREASSRLKFRQGA
jgi:hypothetical protein